LNSTTRSMTTMNWRSTRLPIDCRNSTMLHHLAHPRNLGYPRAPLAPCPWFRQNHSPT
jgi:hypothetical protein